MNILRFERPLFNNVDNVKLESCDIKARHLIIEKCSIKHAVKLNKLWHSRLPEAQLSPWMFAFKAHISGYTFGVALWNNPSARMLPSHWLELRRLAFSDDAPKNTGSKFLSEMVKYFRVNYPEKERCISYQEVEFHSGTIYKASGWNNAYFSKGRKRNRNYDKPGSNRKYRTDSYNEEVAKADKFRWEIKL